MKKKIVQRVLATAMATVVTVGVTACGSETTNGNTPENKEPSKGIEESKPASDADTADEDLGGYTLLKDENGNVYDLGGMEIVIRNWWSDGTIPEPTDDYEEARVEYLDWIQETYNFTIREEGLSSYDSMPEDFSSYATTGGDENYIFTVWQGTALVSAMNNDLMYDLSTLDCLDFSEKKWKGGVHNLMVGTNGEIYGMNPGTPEARIGVYFNKAILEDANINPQDLYTWQENGEWTWEKFADLCEKVQRDTDNDGIIDVYAETSQRMQIYKGAVYSNGGEFIGKEDGKYVNKLETNETLEALNWAMNLMNQYELPIASDAAWDYYVSAFKEGSAAFCIDDGYRFSDFASMEDDWGFVCFPKGPKMDDYTNVYMDNVFTIPACYDADKAWKIAFAYNLYTDPIPGYEDYEGWSSGFYSKSRDLESVELTMARLVKNGKITYHDMVTNINLGADILWTLGYPDSNGNVATPAQRAEALRNTWNSYLEEANK